MTTEYVVVATYTEDAQTVTEVMADGFATPEAAEEARVELAEALGFYFTEDQGGILEVATREEAEMVVTA